MGPANGGPLGPGAVAKGSLLYLTNYRGGGIGDFGAALGRHLPGYFGPTENLESDRQGRGAFRQAWKCAWTGQDLIANVGLTGWGPSGIRNAVGFASLGMHRRRGCRTVVLVHHVIEIFGAAESGYAVTGLIRWGAHWATRQVRRCDLVTFSPSLGDLLRSTYGASSVWVTPLPSDPPRPMPSVDRPPRVVMAGYLAPYKGVSTFLDLAAVRPPGTDFQLIGRPHPILSGRPEFNAEVHSWTQRARSLGVGMPGYLDDRGLDDAMAGPTIGLLPYTSASGGSASFGLFAARGVPVVASDLPEFRYLRDEGAGIRIAGPGLTSYSAAVEALLASPDERDRLAAQQREFAIMHDWTHFVGQLKARMSKAPS